MTNYNSLNTQRCFIHPHFCICYLPSPECHSALSYYTFAWKLLFSLHNPTKESPPLCSGIWFAVYSLVLLEATRKLFQQMESFLTFFPGEKLGSSHDSSFFLSSPWGCKELDRTKQLNWTELGSKGKYFIHLLIDSANVCFTTEWLNWTELNWDPKKNISSIHSFTQQIFVSLFEAPT